MFQKFSFSVLVATILFAGTAPGQSTQSAAADQNTKEYITLLRKDIRKEKSSIVDQAMGLDSAQKAKFYPIYEKYEKELSAIWDKRLANIKKYADNYPDVPDGVADQLVATSQSLQAEHSALWKKYYGEVKSALGPRVAARFLQVENALSDLIDLQLTSQIPLMPQN
jgi:hypothetical protein